MIEIYNRKFDPWLPKANMRVMYLLVTAVRQCAEVREDTRIFVCNKPLLQ